MKNKRAFSVIATTLVCSFLLAFAPSDPVSASDDTAVIMSGVRNDSADEIAQKLYKTLSANNTNSIKTTYHHDSEEQRRCDIEGQKREG